VKLYDGDNWYVEVEGGYYGEEIGTVKPISDINNKLADYLVKLYFSKTTKERFLVTLESEYGYILESIEELDNFEIRNIAKKDIIFGNDGHYKKCEDHDKYEHKDYPLGFVIIDGDKYKLIDGYHRLLATKEKNVDVVVGYKE
jgi:hypothetical protein